MTGIPNDKLHDRSISQYRQRNANMPRDVIFDVIKPNDAGNNSSTYFLLILFLLAC